jgi:hypothetical protein
MIVADDEGKYWGILVRLDVEVGGGGVNPSYSREDIDERIQ